MLAVYSGWLAAALIAAAGALPLVVRLRRRKRAAPTSRPIRAHVNLGLGVAGVSFVHTLLSVLALGDPDVIAAGGLALALGAVGFFTLLAHTGLGFQLQNPDLRHRARIRRHHATTATLIVVAVAIHAALLLAPDG